MARPRMLIVRDGAIGDVIQITPAVRAWAQAGHRVTVCAHGDSADAVLAHNPHVSDILRMPHDLDMPSRKRVIREYVKRHDLPANRWIDLAGTCEGRYLWHSFRAEYKYPLERRREINRGVNYIRRICCDHAAAPDCRMELFASAEEQAWCESFRARFAGKVIVYLQLHGSSLNKAWPYWPILVAALHADPSVVVVSGGSPRATSLERGITEHDGVDLSRYLPLASNGGPSWTLRRSILMTRAAHLVVGPETGLINAAMAWGTQTIIMHSHAAPENLVPEEHRATVTSITPDHRAPCAPCYRIVGDEDGCYRCDCGESWLGSAYRCMAAIEPDRVYQAAKEQIHAHHHHARQPASSAARVAGVPALRPRRADAAVAAPVA